MRAFVPQMALASIAAGADAVMLEVHNSPDCAKSDGDQALLPDSLGRLLPRLRAVANAVGRDL
jgi:3-deoxy-7-phosphoheptulonate synthase